MPRLNIKPSPKTLPKKFCIISLNPFTYRSQVSKNDIKEIWNRLLRKVLAPFPHHLSRDKCKCLQVRSFIMRRHVYFLQIFLQHLRERMAAAVKGIMDILEALLIDVFASSSKLAAFVIIVRCISGEEEKLDP